MGGMISGLLGGGNSAAQEAQQKELAAARAALQQYRPEAMQARINLFNNASTAYQGANNALETMYGGGGGGVPVGQKIPGLHAAPPKTPQTVMGHEMPSAPLPAPGQPNGHPRISDGGSWQDAAAFALDPAGIFRGLF